MHLSWLKKGAASHSLGVAGAHVSREEYLKAVHAGTHDEEHKSFK